MRIVCLILFLFLTSCEDEGLVTQTETFGNPFWLKVGQSVRLQPDNLQLGFQQVMNDSRCPSDVVCVWEGIADLQLWLLKPGSNPVYFKASIYGYVTQSDKVVKLLLTRWAIE